MTTSIVFDNFDMTTLQRPMPKIMVTKHHLLVLGCCYHRLSKQNSTISFSSNYVEESVSDEDIELANSIKDYYSKKLMMLRLKDNKLTKFREDLAKFLHTDFLEESDVHSSPDTYVGMACKLPYFYEYDTSLDKIFDYKKTRYEPFIGEKKLIYLTTLQNKKRHYNHLFEYWFIDQEYNKYCLPFDKNNFLRSLLENIIKKHRLIVSGNFEVLRRDYEYFVPIKYVMDFG